MNEQDKKELQIWRAQGAPYRNIALIFRSIFIFFIGLTFILIPKTLIDLIPRNALIIDSLEYHNVSEYKAVFKSNTQILIIFSIDNQNIADVYNRKTSEKEYGIPLVEATTQSLITVGNGEYILNGYKQISDIGRDSWIFLRVFGYILVIASIVLLFYNPRNSVSYDRMHEIMLSKHDETSESVESHIFRRQ